MERLFVRLYSLEHCDGKVVCETVFSRTLRCMKVKGFCVLLNKKSSITNIFSVFIIRGEQKTFIALADFLKCPACIKHPVFLFFIRLYKVKLKGW